MYNTLNTKFNTVLCHLDGELERYGYTQFW